MEQDPGERIENLNKIFKVLKKIKKPNFVLLCDENRVFEQAVQMFLDERISNFLTKQTNINLQKQKKKTFMEADCMEIVTYVSKQIEKVDLWPVVTSFEFIPAPTVNWAHKEVAIQTVQAYLKKCLSLLDHMKFMEITVNASMGFVIKQCLDYWNANKKTLKGESRTDFLKRSTGLAYEGRSFDRLLNTYLIIYEFPAIISIYVCPPLESDIIDIPPKFVSEFSDKGKKILNYLKEHRPALVDNCNRKVPITYLSYFPRLVALRWNEYGLKHLEGIGTSPVEKLCKVRTIEFNNQLFAGAKKMKTVVHFEENVQRTIRSPFYQNQAPDEDSEIDRFLNGPSISNITVEDSPATSLSYQIQQLSVQQLSVLPQSQQPKEGEGVSNFQHHTVSSLAKKVQQDIEKY